MHFSLKISAFFSLLILIILGAPNAEASNAARFFGQCRYYPQLNAELDCQTDNYLVSFGAHYCEKFQTAAQLFSPQGQFFLKQMRYCLQTELEKIQDLNCQNVGPFGLASHAYCFNRHHFCRLPVWDKVILFKLIIPSLFDESAKVNPGKFEISCPGR